VALTVAATRTGGVVNGGFEAGSAGGWTPGGVVPPAIVSSPVHGGSFAARLGSASPYTGDSALGQTLTIPAGATTLSFWYRPSCPDTVLFDQQQAQIRSTSGATLATVLNVCANTGTWTRVTYDVSRWAGQAVVLYFNVHDDGFPFDASQMYLDDVTVT